MRWRRPASRRAVRLGLLLAVSAATLGASITPANAAAPAEQGWWWRGSRGNGVAPPFVPDGGLWVAADGSGPHAVSAVRYRAPRGREITSLVLNVANETGPEIVLLGCSAAGPWSPAEGGAWSARPATACDVAFVTGKRNASGTVWTFDVRGLARSGTLDLVIMPKQEPGAVFSLTFQRPSASSVVTRPVLSTPSPSSSSSSRASARSPAVLGSQARRPVVPTPSAAADLPTSSPFDFAGPIDPIETARNRLPLIGIAILVLLVPVVLWRRAVRREPPGGAPPPAGPAGGSPPPRRTRFRTRASGVTARLFTRRTPRFA